MQNQGPAVAGCFANFAKPKFRIFVVSLVRYKDIGRRDIG